MTDDSALKLKVAAIQLNSQQDYQENLETTLSLMRSAIRESKAQLLVLPENCFCFGASGLMELVRNNAVVLEAICGFCQKEKVAVVVGSMPVEAEAARYWSQSILISPEGKVIQRYNKVHLFDASVADAHGAYRESDQYQAGNRVAVGTVLGAQLGLSICYDLRFPALYQSMRMQGAEVLTVPAAFTYVTGQAHWEVLIRTRAVETQCFVVAANQCGSHSKGRSTWGHSMIVDPWGRVLAECGQEPSYCVAELDFSVLTEVRRKMPITEHLRPDVYRP